MSGLKGLQSQAERLARKRGQLLTTAHVLLALYQRTSVGVLLSEHGVDELRLIEALALHAEEHPNILALVVERADKAAAELQQGKTSGLHLLLALMREPRAVANRCLERLKVSPAALQRVALARLQSENAGTQVSAAQVVSTRARVAIEREPAVAHGRRKRGPIFPQHRLAEETEQRRMQDRASRTSTPVTVESPLAPSTPPSAPPVALRTTAERATPVRSVLAQTLGKPQSDPFTLDPERFPVLTALGRNLCSAAVQGRIDPVIGRDAEIEQLLDVLSRRRANNPILVGPPGVGKTAIVEGVALALARGQARGLTGKILYEVSAAGLVSGTGVRGALSERLQALVAEVARADGRVIVFIDEIHGVVSAEETADSLSGSLKTALARGELPCIGATTDTEYRRIFERDAALARRFTRIDVDEPSTEAALSIVQAIAPEYEKHHVVAYTKGALRAAVEMSERFMTERRLPDKAIALIDQAGARVRRRAGKRVDIDAIAEVVSEHTGISVERLMLRDGQAMLALEGHLQQRVLGQEQPIAAIAGALRKAAAGFRGNRPLGTFLFLGPTGVGKTEMAKAIGELLFPGREITRLDMSEFCESHSVARMLGAPPGYVGHDDGGQLTEPVRARPYQLVLLDEIEKAHREVLLSLLPMLDEGRLSDGRGRVIDFRNTVIVMTSNLGALPSESRARVGFGSGDGSSETQATEARALAAARAALPLELWNRIDEPLYFRALARDAVLRIADGMVAGVVALMQREHGIALHVDESVGQALVTGGGYDAALGARPMRRTVGRLIEAPLARAILAGDFRRGDMIDVRGVGQQIELTRRSTADAAE